MNVKSLTSFKAQYTAKVENLEETFAVSNKMVALYSQCYHNHNFSFRILLPRSAEHDRINNLSKKLGLKIQGEFLMGLRKLKLNPSVQEFKYIHDKDHYGWLLVDPSFSQDLK